MAWAGVLLALGTFLVVLAIPQEPRVALPIAGAGLAVLFAGVMALRRPRARRDGLGGRSGRRPS